MTVKAKTWTISGTTPAAPGQAVLGSPIATLDEYDAFLIYASLVGAAGGTLDVYLQAKIDTDVWVDWVHFPQLGAGATAIKYSGAPGLPNSLPVVGVSTDAGTGAPALAVNTMVGGHPGDTIRCLVVAGASTSAGAAISIKIKGRRAPK